MKAHNDSGGIAPLILNLEVEWLTSRHYRFNPKERIPVHIEWMARWVPSPVRTSGEAVNLFPFPDLNPAPSNLYPICYID
jgi:hypothetical protein